MTYVGTIRIQKIVLIDFLLLPILIQLSGCSYARYPSGDLSKNSSLARVDVNNPIFGVELTPIQVNNKSGVTSFNVNEKNGVISFEVNKGDVITTYRHDYITPKIEFGADKTISVKYHYSHRNQAPNVYITVEFPNGRGYTAAVDTGYEGVVTLTSDIVLDNNLAIWPFDLFGIGWEDGICQIPELNIGSIKTRDIAAHYTEQRWQYRIFNIPVYKQSKIILGLHLIRNFDYVIFDNINKNVVFSKDGAFEPDDTDLWQTYPFGIKRTQVLNGRLMVQIPINGQIYELLFDSCGSNPGLMLNKNHWQDIEKNLNVKRLVNSKVTTWEGMVWPCKKATVSEISIGEITIKNTVVGIFDEPERLSMFSLGYFQDTAVVLDFVNNLMWIKR